MVVTVNVERSTDADVSIIIDKLPVALLPMVRYDTIDNVEIISGGIHRMNVGINNVGNNNRRRKKKLDVVWSNGEQVY